MKTTLHLDFWFVGNAYNWQLIQGAHRLRPRIAGIDKVIDVVKGSWEIYVEVLTMGWRWLPLEMWQNIAVNADKDSGSDFCLLGWRASG